MTLRAYEAGALDGLRAMVESVPGYRAECAASPSCPMYKRPRLARCHRLTPLPVRPIVVLCHNICALVQSVYELNIAPVF